MKKVFRDKNGTRIKEPSRLKFTVLKEQETLPTVFEAPVKIKDGMMGWFCENSKEVMLFRNFYPNGNVNDAEIIK